MFVKKLMFEHYQALFKMYGILGRKCLAKARANPDEADVWLERAQWCINKRRDILQVLMKLTGLN